MSGSGAIALACEGATIVGPRGALFKPVTFQLAAGEVVCLVGPNGVGKSLFLRALSRSPLPRGFRLEGSARIGTRGVGGVFHLPQLQVPEIHLPYRLGEIANLDGHADERFAWFDRQVASRAWNVASGGERMRALLARAFASRATLLLLDEPFNHLDTHAARAVRETMRVEAGGPLARNVVFVSHAEALEGVVPGGARLLEIRPPDARQEGTAHV